MNYGIEIELAVLLLVQTIFMSAFSRFESETPLFKKLIKWLIVDLITLGIYYFWGHWAVIFPIIALIPGTIYHFIWCKKNGIDPWKATPRKKYYELRHWKWRE